MASRFGRYDATIGDVMARLRCFDIAVPHISTPRYFGEHCGCWLCRYIMALLRGLAGHGWLR